MGRYSFVPEGVVDGVEYVTVLDEGGNPQEYNLPRDVAEGRVMGEYPHPWHAEERVGLWYVVDARGGIVAGSFPSASAAWDWIERMYGGA